MTSPGQVLAQCVDVTLDTDGEPSVEREAPRKKLITVSLGVTHLQQLKALSVELDVPITYLIREAIRAWLKRRENMSVDVRAQLTDALTHLQHGMLSLQELAQIPSERTPGRTPLD